MSNKNPYTRGTYQAAFAFMQKKGVFTKEQLVGFILEKGLTKLAKDKDAAADATATVLLSPREADSKRGDCRGNFSAHGEAYFVKPLKKVKGEARKYQLRYRATVLARRVRPVTKPVDGAKKAKKAVKVKKTAKVKKAVKVTKATKTTKTTKKVAKKAIKPVAKVAKAVIDVVAPTVEPVAPVAPVAETTPVSPVAENVEVTPETVAPVVQAEQTEQKA